MRNVIEELFWANWGSWDGRAERVRLWDPDLGRPSAVTVTGESGAGKSTIMDGLTHLTQRGSVRYNQSARRAGQGRAGDARTTFDYVIGSYDTEVADGGLERALTLRDRSRACVSYFGATWADVDDPDSVVSACAFDFLPANGARDDLRECLVIADGPLDPARGVAAIGAGPLTPGVVLRAYPGASAWDGRSERGRYLAQLRARLGTNDEAMRISDRILSGTTPAVVDDLFHQLVFHEPEAPSRAAEALGTYRRHDREWKAYAEARERLSMLSDVAGSISDYEAATREEGILRVALVEGDDGRRPVDRWLDGLEAGYAKEGIAERTADLEGARATLAEAEDASRAAAEAFARAQAALAASPAQRVPEWRAELDRTVAEAGRRRATRSQAEALMGALGREMPGDAGAWREAMAALAEDDASWEADDGRAQEAEDAALACAVRASDAASRAAAEVEAYRAHRTNVTPQMMEARSTLARAVGLDESEMPYVAELVDAAPGQEEWRRAVNDALAPITRLVLVDGARVGSREAFRRRADGAERSLRRRVRWEFVDTRADEPWEARDGHVSGVVAVDDSSPFASHVRAMVSGRVTDYGLTRDPADLSRPDMMLPSGQASTSRGGAVGRAGGVIVGFTAQTALGEAEERLAGARADEAEAASRLREARAAHARLREAHDARARLARVAWADVDPAGAEARASELRSLIAQAEADPGAASLRRDYDLALAARDEQALRQAQAKAAVAAMEGAVAALGARARDAGDASAADVPADVADVLDARFADYEAHRAGAHGWRLLLPDAKGRVPFDQARDGFSNGSLPNARAALRERAAKARARAHDGMVAYFSRNPDSGLPGTDFDHDRASYVAELESLRHQQLERPEAPARRRLVAESCRALGDAVTTYEDERKRLRAQVREVSALLQARPYPGGGVVCLVTRQAADDGTRALHARIRDVVARGLGAEAPDGMSDDDVARLHAELARLVADMAPDRGAAPAGFDPRRSIEVRARIDMPDGTSVAADSTGTRSGGESQTLMAFLTGAAMLYALGATDGQPAYAPMLMDEAFSIADKEHTEAAVGAILGLGFQLVCVVAENKAADFEDSTDVGIDVWKDASHRSHLSEWQAVA